MEPPSRASIYRQILLGKLSLAVITNVTFQVTVLLLYISIVNLNFITPLSSLSVLFKPSVYLHLIPFLGIIFVQSVICAKDYITGDCYNEKRTRFRRFIEIFAVRNLILLSVNILTGFSTVWLYLSLSVSNLNSGDYFYLFFGGAFAGFYYSVRVYKKEKNGLFPVVRERKWLRFKGGLIGIINSCKFSAIYPSWHLIWFYMFLSYYFEKPIEGKLFLYILSYLFNFLIYFNLSVSAFLYDIFLTEPLEFPIVSDWVCLKDAMRFEVPVIVKLACWDFFSLTGNDKHRRSEIFSLSQPGGHPHNWNGLIETVLRILHGYTEILRNSSIIGSSDEQKNLKIEEINCEIANSYKYNKLRPLVDESCNMNFSQTTRDFHQSFSSQGASPIRETQNVPDKPPFYTEKLNSLKKKCGYNYLFVETPCDADLKKSLMTDGQIIIWTVQALTSITSASIKEDRYGIVQKDLPVILTSLVELKKGLDKLNRGPAFLSKRDDCVTKMKNAVVNAVKRSLFQLCVDFGPYLKDLNLKKEVLAQLHAFVPSVR